MNSYRNSRNGPCQGKRLGLFMMKLTSGKGQRHEGDIEAFIKTLPYQLTSAQKKVVDEISRDIESDITHALSRTLCYLA